MDVEFSIEVGVLIINAFMVGAAFFEMRSNSNSTQAVLISIILNGLALTEISGKIDEKMLGGKIDSDDQQMELVLNQLELYATFKNEGMIKNKKLASFYDDNFIKTYDNFSDYLEKNPDEYPQLRAMAKNMGEGKGRD